MKGGRITWQDNRMPNNVSYTTLSTQREYIVIDMTSNDDVVQEEWLEQPSVVQTTSFVSR